MKVYAVIDEVTYQDFSTNQPARGSVRIVYKGEMDKLPEKVQDYYVGAPKGYFETYFSSLQDAREYHQKLRMDWSRDKHNIAFIDET